MRRLVLSINDLGGTITYVFATVEANLDTLLRIFASADIDLRDLPLRLFTEAMLERSVAMAFDTLLVIVVGRVEIFSFRFVRCM